MMQAKVKENFTKTQTDKAKVLALTTSYPSHEEDPSGVFIAKLLKAIRKRGYFVKVVAPSDGTFYGRRNVAEIETIRFGYFWPRSLERLTRGGGGIPENMAHSLLARLQLFPMMIAFFFVSIVQSRGADIVYANWLGAGIVGALVNLFTRKPLVVSFRGDDGYLARDRYIWRILTKWVIARTAVVAPVSGELLDIIRGLGTPEGKCRLPRFGVDIDMFHPAKAKADNGPEVRLLFVGSLTQRKGLNDLLEALDDPALENVRLTIVGEGLHGSQFMEMCERLGLMDRTDWKGLLPPLEVAAVMRSSDILCLPSYMEGRPNAVNEAMASGLPVIATRVGGIPDMAPEGKTALLFDAGNMPQLRQCLIRLVSDPELRKKMGAAGREFLVRTGVSWDSTAEEFDSIFSGILSNHSG
jgi:glycosyltransferase involved in cell wall biosynthesis